MMILALTPYEALGTFTGLEIQATLRAALAFIPVLIWMALTYGIVTRMGDQSRAAIAGAVIKYSAVVLFIVGAFWPEAFGHIPGTLAPSAVESGIAKENNGPHPTAAALDPTAQATTVPAMTLVFIRGLSELTFNIGKALHEGATRPASFVMPLNWMLRQRLSHEQRIQTKEWAEDCVAKAHLNLQTRGVQLSFSDSLPFPGTPVGTELSQIRAPVGRNLLNIVREMANCGAVGQEIVGGVTAKLNGLTTPGGTSMTAVWRDELGVTVEELSRMLVYREVQHQLGNGGATVPSLKGEIAAIGAAQVAAGALRGFLSGLGGLNPIRPLTSAGAAVAGDLEGVLLGLVSWLMPSMMFLEYAPPMLGFVQGVFLAMMPLALVLALVPGTPFRPLFLYFAWLGILYSSPIWWGFIELFIATFSDVAPSLIENPVQWGYTVGLKLILQTFGILVALVVGFLLTGLTGFAAIFARLN